MDMSFTLIEILAFAGLFQSLSILVYLFLKSGRLALAFVPILFFINLTAALYVDFGVSFFEIGAVDLTEIRFWLWIFICPLSILFILQFSDLRAPLSIQSFSALLPLIFAMGVVIYFDFQDVQVMYIAGAIGATLSLPFLWFKKNVLRDVLSESSGQERYWMILSLIALIVILVSLIYALLGDQITRDQYVSVRTVIGLLFVYLSATYMFRIYPPPIRVLTRSIAKDEVLNAENAALLEKIKHKLEYEKVYLEAAYGRSDMARELEISESLLSKLMNQNFNDNFPSVLNKYRVSEACQLLEQTDAPINVISDEVGFNSLATFNRVFKEQVLETASQYRQKKVKENSRIIA